MFGKIMGAELGVALAGGFAVAMAAAPAQAHQSSARWGVGGFRE